MSLEVRGLNSGYGDMVVLKDINLQVEDGGLVVVIGPNGAGKTTLLRSIFNLDMITTFEGEITYNGSNLVNQHPSEIVKKVAFMPAGSNVFPSLTVKENLEMARVNLHADFESKLEEIFDLFPRIEERQTQKAGTLSGGETQMLAMSCALVPDLDLMLLDEPSGGLQPNFVDMLFDNIRNIHDLGKTILLVEQTAKQALESAGRGYVLESGEIVLSAESDDLLENEEIAERYLGV